MYDAGDRKDIRRLEKAARLAEAQRGEIIKGLMSLAPGRAWMHDLISECHVFSTPFTSDPQTTAFNCGKQSIGLQLFGDVVSTCPNEYVLMMQERNLCDASRDSSASRRQAPGTDLDGGDQGSDEDLAGYRDEEGNPAFDDREPRF